MNAIDELRRDLHRLGTFCGVEPAVTAAKAKDFGDAVAIVQFEKQRADDVVEAGAEAATRHNTRPRLFRIEEELGTRARKLELKSWICADFDPLRDAELVADRVAVRRGETWLAESRGVHRNRAIARRPMPFTFTLPSAIPITHTKASTPTACATGCVLWSSKSQFTRQAAGAAAFTSALAPAA
jgi:hypothetical protein